MATTGPCPQQASHSVQASYRQVRRTTEQLCEQLDAEDCVVQSASFASPVKWHLAHTTWFFETFVLRPHEKNFRAYDDAFEVLFNSYYNSVGSQFPRPQRGLLTRPTLAETFSYRRNIDERVQELLESASEELLLAAAPVIELGLHHEMQHQELILTDAKHLLSHNPLAPAILKEIALRDGEHSEAAGGEIEWLSVDGGRVRIGAEGGSEFCFDNETPAHDYQLIDFAIADRLATNAEFLEFIDDGGFRRPELWLSEGWHWVQAQGRSAPLYWRRDGDAWREFTLAGLQPLASDSPVCHLCYYEADAFARWSQARLPTEQEWEHAVRTLRPADGSADGAMLEDGIHRPAPAAGRSRSVLRQAFGDAWEWTASAYSAYPGYCTAAGALGEYNGKFMCNQFVLRAGSIATPRRHLRATYRNFFPADAAWQFSGVRLARDA